MGQLALDGDIQRDQDPERYWQPRQVSVEFPCLLEL